MIRIGNNNRHSASSATSSTESHRRGPGVPAVSKPSDGMLLENPFTQKVKIFGHEPAKVFDEGDGANGGAEVKNDTESSLRDSKTVLVSDAHLRLTFM